MAITQNTYTGNGSTTNYSFTFPYLETTDIKVSVNGVNTNAYTLANATTISFNTAPANGAAIRIYRDTDDAALSATFYPGSAIRSQDLNDNFTQNLYVVQEINNNAVQIDGSQTMVGDLDMGGYQINNLAEPTVDDDAATKFYIDQRYGSTTIPAHTRWRKTATAGQTTFSGTGDYGGTLAYSALREQVYLNGALQQRSADYTADNGTSIVFSVPLTVGDVVDVVCVNNTNTSGISNAANLSYGGQFSGQTVRTVAAKLADVVSVKDFGAVGDGVADDTAAIQAAIDSGKAAFVPKGVYKITATLNLLNGYKALIGDESLPVITKTTAGPAIYIGTTVGANLNEYSRLENLYLKNTTAPTFSANPGPSDAGVVLDGSNSTIAAAVQNAKVWNVRVGNWSCGFYTNDVVGCTIESCFVQLLVDYTSSPGFTGSNKFCGFSIDATPYVVGGISPQASIEIISCDVGGAGTPTNVTSIGFYIAGTDIRDIFFDNCETSNTSYGYFIATSGSDYHWDVQIKRPIIDAYKLYGIYITGATGPGSITIDGGYFVGTGASAGACIYAVNSNGITVTGGVQLLGLANDNATDDGVRLDSCNSCAIVGNNFVNLNYGVSLNGSKNCSVVGNYFYAAATATEANPALYDAIRIFGASEENTIVGNVIKGKDGTDVYSNGVLVAASCPRNVIVGNTIDPTSVINAYNISDTSTTLLSSDALELNSRTVNIKSSTSDLILQGGDGTNAVRFRDSTGVARAYVTELGYFKAAGRLGLQGNDASYPITFLDGGSNVISRIDNTGNITSSSNNVSSLGSSSFRWANTYSTNIRPGDGTVIWTTGTGTPEGVVTAPVGSLFTRTDGGASTTLYVKQSGTGNTGWVAK